MGSGRSGSTLLDIVLGSHPDIQGVGELVNLVKNGWLQNEHCSCGKPANDCPFWSQVRQVWGGRGIDSFERYTALQGSFEHYRNLPALLRKRRDLSPRFQEYAESTRILFEVIRDVGGKPIVVDSSKNPVRALALSKVPGIDLRLVHLTRDGRGLVSSLSRSWRKDEEVGVTRDIKARPVWRTAVFWLAVNLLSGWVRWQLAPKKSIRVRYESLVTNPKGVLGEIGRLVNVDLAPVANAISRGDAIAVGHNVAGNRLRMSRSVRLRPQAGQWKNMLSHEQQQLSWLLMGWLLRHYGYKK